jgi:molybdate-binding protein/DNA-binding XRE family transcriptional regulator
MATIHATRLQSLRRAAGLSQRALAARTGISRQAVGAIEAGRMQPSVGIALELARALGASVEDVFGAADAADAQPLPRRVATGTVDGHSVSHPLDTDAHLAIEPSETAGETVFIAGCDLTAGLLSRHASARSRDVRCLWLPMTNRAALAALTTGRVHAALLHAAAAPDFTAFEVATTEEGWLVARGNPLGFRGARDLAGGGVRFVNRPPGAAARTLFDENLRRAGVDPLTLADYERVVPGQLDAGRAVAQGFADVAIGMASVARVCGLDFISLRGERCSLVVRQPSSGAGAGGGAARALLDALRSVAFRRELQALDSYDVTNIGERLA